MEELISLLKACLKPNFCEFNEQYYQFPEGIGVPMGSPLASTLAELFMHRLETEFFASNPEFNNNIIYWKRYVDDILFLWNGTADTFDKLITKLKNIYHSIKITVEHVGKEINLLDIKISITDNTHTFGIYRKPTCSDILINDTSYCPASH